MKQELLIMERFKAIAIGGVPASGKSTLMKQFITDQSLNNKFKNWSYGLLNGVMFDNTYIIGTYKADQVFGGTDRLSMAAPASMQNFINAVHGNIVFEGDRLFTLNIILMLIKKFETHVIVLNNDEKTLEQRHKERKDSQSKKFQKGRKTKINNILLNKDINSISQIYQLNTFDDTRDLAKNMHKIIYK
tara:strand:+ start:734 stop:1300 length:567 start_codon:yes stop_codon:yes gene_type:complete